MTRRRRPALRRLSRAARLTSRTLDDYQAARSGRLVRRVARRSVTGRLMRKLWGN